MKFKKIVGFGDSWMVGDELDPATQQQDCFLGQLGQHYDLPIENFGICGSSLQSAMWTFQYWLMSEPNPSECLVLVGLTSSYRFSHFNPQYEPSPSDVRFNYYVHSGWPLERYSSDFRDLIKMQTVLACSDEWKVLNYRQAVWFFDGVSARRNIPMVQFNIMPDFIESNDIPTLAWPDRNLKNWVTNQGQQYLAPEGHPNKLGHELIAQRLINHIDHVIINA